MAFCRRQLLNIVVEIYHRHRLDKHGGASGRLIMDNTREIGLVFQLNRHYISVPTHGDNGFLEILLVFVVV